MAKNDAAIGPNKNLFGGNKKVLGIGAVIIAAIIGIGIYYAKRDSGPGRISVSELHTAGPLGDKMIGDPKAPVTIVEYASITCPHCAVFHIESYPELKKNYIDTGKVKLIFREFPTQPAKIAISGFMLAHCAGDRYFPFINALFEQQQQWRFDPYQGFLRIAKQAGMSQQSFEKCLEDGKLAGEIENVAKRGAEKFGVESTPTFFINGTKVEGALPAAEFAKIIDPMLK